MRVAVDASSLQQEPRGGVARSFSQVVGMLAEAVDLTLLTDARMPPLDIGVRTVVLDAWPRSGLKTLWLQRSVRRWLDGFDGVFHGLFYAVPFGIRVPSVVSLHDLSFEVHPEGQPAARRRLYQLQARYSARHSAAIVTHSEYAKAQLVEHYGVAPECVLVALHAVDPVFDVRRVEAAPALAAELGIRMPYVIALGGAARRGVEVAVDAWRTVRASGADVDLVVVGAADVRPEPGVVTVGAVDDVALAKLFAGAETFVYPTRYEGFGMPALEAAASGTPVVCARVGSLPEVLGDAAEWCEEPSVEAIAKGLDRVLSDHDLARCHAENGLARVRSWPGWQQHAEALLEAYRRALA